MSLQQSVNRLITYASGWLGEVETSVPESAHIVRRTMYCAILDALSTATYPNEGEGKGFARFVAEFCGWDDAERVSLPMLNMVLNQAKNKDMFRCLVDLVRNELARWDDEEPLTSDWTIDDIRAHWPQDNAGYVAVTNPNDCKIYVEGFQHCSLIYQERNYLVHQLCTLSSGLYADGENKPFHFWVENSGLELVYPHRFLSSLCHTALENGRLKSYLLEQGIDPTATLKKKRSFLV